MQSPCALDIISDAMPEEPLLRDEPRATSNAAHSCSSPLWCCRHRYQSLNASNAHGALPTIHSVDVKARRRETVCKLPTRSISPMKLCLIHSSAEITNMPAAKTQYTKSFTLALQWMWGDGYLSPGGRDEVAAMIGDVPVKGRKLLDIGCGLGAIDVLLAETYGAASVLGIDVEPPLIEHAKHRAETAGVSDRVQFRLVEPGPLPLADASYDIVFTKDAIVHIPDKTTFYAEILRVLKSGGVLIGSDWLRGGDDTFTDNARQWLESVHLNFQMQDLAQTRRALEQAGFENVVLTDRNAWYRSEIANELERVTGENFDRLVELIGADDASYRQRSSMLKKQAIDDGFLRPTHFIGYKASS